MNKKNLQIALESVFKDRKIAESNNFLCVPAYNITEGRNRIFKKDYMSKQHTYNIDDELSYVDVALATAAAPTYFPIKTINSIQYVDGGLWANNPLMVGLSEYIRNFSNECCDFDAIEVISISTCQKIIKEPIVKRVNRSFWGWKQTLFDLFTIGQVQSVNFFLEQIQPYLSFNLDICRLENEPLSAKQDELIEMDNASPEALNLMIAKGNNTWMLHKDDTLIKKILTTTKSINPKTYGK